jgi:AcrR family transcriptional regulator
MKKNNLPSKDRKAQILSAARTLFAKKGFAGTSLDDIAEKTGVSRPRIIQLFGSKVKIFEAIAKEAYNAHPMDKDMAEPIRKKDDFGIFKAFAKHVFSNTRTKENRENLIILTSSRLKNDRFYQIHFEKKDLLMMSRIEGYIKERFEDGIFTGVDYKTITFAYQAMVTNLAIYKNVKKQLEHISIDELSSSCARIFLNGILKTPVKQ